MLLPLWRLKTSHRQSCGNDVRILRFKISNWNWRDLYRMLSRIQTLVFFGTVIATLFLIVNDCGTIISFGTYHTDYGECETALSRNFNINWFSSYSPLLGLEALFFPFFVGLFSYYLGINVGFSKTRWIKTQSLFAVLLGILFAILVIGPFINDVKKF